MPLLQKWPVLDAVSLRGFKELKLWLRFCGPVNTEAEVKMGFPIESGGLVSQGYANLKKTLWMTIVQKNPWIESKTNENFKF